MARCSHCGQKDATFDHVVWCRDPDTARARREQAEIGLLKLLTELRPQQPQRLTVTLELETTKDDLVDVIMDINKAFMVTPGTTLVSAWEELECSTASSLSSTRSDTPTRDSSRDAA